MMGMMGYQDRYFTVDSSHITWYDDKDYSQKSTLAAALGSVQISQIKGIELVPGVTKGKFGLEIKGPDKSYFLWSSSKDGVEDLFRKLQSLTRK